MRAFLFGGRGGGGTASDIGLLLVRLVTGLSLALAHGIHKIPPSPGLVQGVGKLGFPVPLVFAWAAGLSESVAAFLIALGLLTRPAALAVACTMAVAVFGVHGADPFEKKELALLYLAPAVLLSLAGAGRFGIDRLIKR